ncbi:MAG: agglutinin biogenesis protein MshI [Gammaproteobacteria bacterium]|jgi:MSHA biogenesis protein MshI|nr:agglutinin biogenesis protein MshI [Gammaproteobacteria bacterium]
MAFWQKQASEDSWTAVMFGSDRIVIAEIAQRGDGLPQVRTCDSFVREGGELDALKRLKHARHLAHARCTTLLWHGQYQLLQIDAPDNARDLPHEELREAMRWRIKEMVDYPIENAGVDVIDIPAPGSRNPQMWVVVASHDVLVPRVHLFQDAKLSLAAIDIPEMAQRNLATLFEEPNRGLALAAFDDKGGRLTISYKGELFMTRHIDVGAPELTGPQAESLHERVLLDIQRSLDNFDRNYSAIPLTRLMIGPLPGGEAFVNYLGMNLSLPVAMVNLADVLDIGAVPQLADIAVQADAWLALGAALRDRPGAH